MAVMRGIERLTGEGAEATTAVDPDALVGTGTMLPVIVVAPVGSIPEGAVNSKSFDLGTSNPASLALPRCIRIS